MWKIAIIDDDRAVLQGMRKIIPWDELEAEHAGEAMDGQQGLKLIASVNPDIVITDIYMPLMNGLDMVEELRKIGYEGKIVILSGFADFEYARQALRLNVDDYLSKPITVQTIKSVLEKAIAQLEGATVHKLEQHQLKQKLMQYEPFVEQEWVKAVVTGNVNLVKPFPPSVQGLLPHGEDASDFLVIAVEILRTVRVSELSPSDFNLFRFAVGNILQEVISADWKNARLIELHSQHMAVLLHAPHAEREAGRLRIRSLCDSMMKHVEDYLKVKLEIGIGSWKGRWQEIADSTEEAFQALAAKRNAPFPGLPMYEWIRDHDLSDNQSALLKPTELRPVQFYQQLGEAIRHLQESQIEEVIERFFQQLEGARRITEKDVRNLGLETWAILTYSLLDAGVRVAELFDTALLKEEVQQQTVPDKLKAWLLDKVSVICQLSGKSEKLKHKQAVDFMVQYIHEHYAEDLHLSELAEKVYISRNYLSTIFRQATGETFNNYVTRVRMEKAKSMILEGRWMIYEVAERVGYKNVPYFTTLFKKHTGTNPTEFVKN
ncbi:response regulator transcription factor [Paenibacillus foliorum]|nr:response regulator transcription factor [Paenibacillus foliorum]